MDFWISGFLDFWISGFLISGFLDHFIANIFENNLCCVVCFAICFRYVWISGFLNLWISVFLFQRQQCCSPSRVRRLWQLQDTTVEYFRMTEHVLLLLLLADAASAAAAGCCCCCCCNYCFSFP
jgi:hypothetical protein